MEIERCFGVYLLYCLNPKYKGHTYIGFTVNPNRRVKQHNTGTQAGGAKRTSGRGPWEMVLIVHGFLSDISALQFEWAWQNPHKSRRLRHVASKKKKQTQFEYKFSVLTDMLRCGPWNRQPLTVRWLKQEYQLNFDPLRLPPVHMATAYGPVVSKTVVSKTTSQEEGVTMATRCNVCHCPIQATSNTLHCLRPSCDMCSHTLCLARVFLNDSPGQLLPVDGQCPSCHTQLLWGDLVRFKLGCYRNLSQARIKLTSPSIIMPLSCLY
ncbi:hypothetical protein NP493_165g01033 [Ridgeia piscesae]|uniref:Structure-specific endonuclease subunit SLX1 homolog n=1 Tax=Ridgeia piscesae TaxID=27915 RepID=A0AAD9UFH0_RIDPI|nr:hypothetical protein NP493_165g01033 [Ridgeia piscesae]